MHKVLGEMKGEETESPVSYSYCFTFRWRRTLFEGIVEGKILEQQQGENRIRI